MLLQNTPNPFNWIVFARVGWIISQIDSNKKVINKLCDTLHKLSTPAVVFGPIVQIKQQGFDLWKPLFLREPKMLQAVNDKVTGDL